MCLKYDSVYADDDDFQQIGEEMHELTVTITLCEYRKLIRAAEKLERLELFNLVEKNIEGETT